MMATTRTTDLAFSGGDHLTLLASRADFFGLNLSAHPDIAQQAYYVNLLNPSDSPDPMVARRVWIDIADMVILSHLLDDVFDEDRLKPIQKEQFTDTILHFSPIEKTEVRVLFHALLLQSYPPIAKSKVKVATIFPRLTQLIEQLSEGVDQSQSPRSIAMLGFIKLALAGLIMNSYSGLGSALVQSRLSAKFREITNTISLFQEGKIIYPRGLRLPYETLVSTASSLQEIFAPFAGNFTGYETQLWNGILGPLVFLSNITKERTRNPIILTDSLPYCSAEEYRDFLLYHWEKLVEYYKEPGKLTDAAKKKLLVLSMAVHMMQTDKYSNHSFRNYPKQLQGLGAVFTNIVSEAVHLGFISDPRKIKM